VDRSPLDVSKPICEPAANVPDDRIVVTSSVETPFSTTSAAPLVTATFPGLFQPGRADVLGIRSVPWRTRVLPA